MRKKPKIEMAPDFADLIPPLRAEERDQLKKNLQRDGCREPLVTWNGMLLDGHHRYEVCEELGIPYETHEITTIRDRSEAKRWIVQNQIGRRNLSDYQRAELVLNLKPLIQAKARENLKTGSSGIRGGSPLKNSSNAIHTREELARLAGVSEDTVRKVELILRTVPEETKQKLRSGETSINEQYAKLVKSGLIFTRSQDERRIETPAKAGPDFPDTRQDSNAHIEILAVVEKFFERADNIRISAAARELSLKDAERLLKIIRASVVWLEELEKALNKRLNHNKSGRRRPEARVSGFQHDFQS